MIQEMLGKQFQGNLELMRMSFPFVGGSLRLLQRGSAVTDLHAEVSAAISSLHPRVLEVPDTHLDSHCCKHWSCCCPCSLHVEHMDSHNTRSS